MSSARIFVILAIAITSGCASVPERGGVRERMAAPEDRERKRGEALR